MAAQLFDRLPLRKLPPDEAVALGAAVQAALEAGDHTVADLVVTDVAPFTLGMSRVTRLGDQLVTGIFAPIIERGTVIPASRVKRFFTASDLQTVIVIVVYQGEHSSCDKNQKLGEYRVEEIPRALAGKEAVDVRFTYDLNGILEVETTVVSTMKRTVLVIERTPGRLSKEDVERARQEMQRLKFHPRDALPNVTALARADALYVELTGWARAELGAGIASFRAGLEGQVPEISLLRDRLVGLVERLRRP
jgi:molecular chaperone HscC